MFFRRKKYVTISAENMQIYSGHWNDLPLSENIIIQKSIEFFDDPAPCFIHRDAVRIRLLADLEDSLSDSITTTSPEWLHLISEYMGQQVTYVAFSEK